MPETKALSTELSSTYRITEEPKNVKIEIGKTYKLSDGSGTKDVKIVSIRKIDEEILIYYKYEVQNNLSRSILGNIWDISWRDGQCTLNTFKAQLLAFGQLNSIDLLYPQRKDKENYYPTNN